MRTTFILLAVLWTATASAADIPEVPTKPATAQRFPCAIEQGCIDECRSGNAGACSTLGGRRCALSEIAGAAKYWQRACELGNADSCGLRGVTAERSSSVRASVRWHEKGCEGGSALSCWQWGRALHLLRDYDAAMSAWFRGCELGAHGACEMVGAYYLAGAGTEADVVKARQVLEATCAVSGAGACRLLNDLDAHGVQSDPAALWAEANASCRSGDAASCGQKGLFLRLGVGVLRDEQEAARAYEAACRGGSKEDCRTWALLFPVHSARRTAALELGCAAGSDAACAERAVSLLTAAGDCSLRVPAVVLDRLDKACRAGQTFACAQLERHYRHRAHDPAQADAYQQLVAPRPASAARHGMRTLRGFQVGCGPDTSAFTYGESAPPAPQAPPCAEIAALHASEEPDVAVLDPPRTSVPAPDVSTEPTLGPVFKWEKVCEPGECLERCKAGDGKACAVAGTAQCSDDPTQAFRTWSAGCNLGDATSCGMLGLRDQASDLRAALAHFDHGCALGDRAACWNRARVLDEAGRGSAAGAWFHACEVGDMNACYEVGTRKLAGDGVPMNLAHAFTIMSQLCGRQYQAACAVLEEFEAVGVKADDTIDLAQARRDCAKNRRDCAKLGDFFRLGIGVRTDARKAADAYKTACGAGHGDACAWWARSVDTPSKRVDRALASACRDGSAASCGQLHTARAYRAKTCRVPVLMEDLDAMQRACHAGDGISCRHVANHTDDPVQAERWRQLSRPMRGRLPWDGLRWGSWQADCKAERPGRYAPKSVEKGFKPPDCSEFGVPSRRGRGVEKSEDDVRSSGW